MHNLQSIRRIPCGDLNIYQHALLEAAEQMLHVRKFANEVRTSAWMKQPFYRETLRRLADTVETRLTSTLFAFSSPIIWMMGSDVFEEYDLLKEACFNETAFLTSDAYLLGEQQ
ncbi:hypothetical protein D3C72_1259680 [compost metagenome]|uniref:hypothetical protein n=1 Tax=Achromobacter insolitus TaxID=217204 RepID=UPI000FAA8A46